MIEWVQRGPECHCCKHWVMLYKHYMAKTEYKNAGIVKSIIQKETGSQFFDEMKNIISKCEFFFFQFTKKNT